MGKPDLKVALGLLVLGVALGWVVLSLSSGGLTVQSEHPARPAPGTAIAPSHPAAVVPLNQEPEPKSGHALHGAQAKVVHVDPDTKTILAELMIPASPDHDGAAEHTADDPKVQTVITLSETTRIEQVVVEPRGQARAQGVPRRITMPGFQLADLHPGDVVWCSYRTETREALEEVEVISRVVERDDLEAYVNGAEFKAWLATQPAYVKGRIVAIDPARRTITYQGYMVNRIPKGFPRQTVVVGQGAQVYEVEDESRLEAPQRRRALNELRPGQTILFPVTRALLQTGAKTYHTDTILVIGKGG